MEICIWDFGKKGVRRDKVIVCLGEVSDLDVRFTADWRAVSFLRFYRLRADTGGKGAPGNHIARASWVPRGGEAAGACDFAKYPLLGA